MCVSIHIAHPQTDCFVLSELFSVTRYVGRLKSRSNFTSDLISDRTANNRTSLAKGIIKYYLAVEAASVCLHFDTLSASRVLNSFEELRIMRAATENSFARVLNPHGGAYKKNCNDKRDSFSELGKLCLA